MLVSWKISPLFSNLKTQNPFFRIHKQNMQDFWHIQFFQYSFFSAQDHSQPVSKQRWEFISHWIKKQKWRKQCLQCFQQTYLQRVVCSLATCLHLVALEKSEVDTVESVNKLMFFNNRSTIFCDSPKLLTLTSAMKAGCHCYNTGITFPPLCGDYTDSLFCFLCCHFMNKNMVHHRCYILILLLVSVLLICNVRSTLRFYQTNYWFAYCPEDTEDLVQRSEFRNQVKLSENQQQLYFYIKTTADEITFLETLAYFKSV